MNRISRTRTANMTMILAALAAIVAAGTPTAAQATSMRLVNYVAYTYLDYSADLSTEGVENLDETQSGPLRMELWAFAAPYAGATSGSRLATYSLAAMAAGARTGAIDSGQVPYVPPAAGIWYFSMLLTEYTGVDTDNDGYVVRYWINFQTPEYIGVPRPPNKVAAIEFYHAGFDHYFIAASAQDAFDLDSGVHPGWARTGYVFNVWDAPSSTNGAVCRYYIPPAYGDSHFFSASAYECAIALVKFPFLIKESDAAFYLGSPDNDTGACAGNEVAVYRLWNGRADSNHRYTTSTTVKAMMIANGYIAEGYGPDQVDMCAAQ